MAPRDQGSRGACGYGYEHPAERDAGGQHDDHRREAEQERDSGPDDAPTSGVREATRDAKQRQSNGEQQSPVIGGIVEVQVREAPDVPGASAAIRPISSNLTQPLLERSSKACYCFDGHRSYGRVLLIGVVPGEGQSRGRRTRQRDGRGSCDAGATPTPPPDTPLHACHIPVARFRRVRTVERRRSPPMTCVGAALAT